MTLLETTVTQCDGRVLQMTVAGNTRSVDRCIFTCYQFHKETFSQKRFFKITFCIFFNVDVIFVFYLSWYEN
jgi:hypothetical protein